MLHTGAIRTIYDHYFIRLAFFPVALPTMLTSVPSEFASRPLPPRFTIWGLAGKTDPENHGPFSRRIKYGGEDRMIGRGQRVIWDFGQEQSKSRWRIGGGLVRTRLSNG